MFFWIPVISIGHRSLKVNYVMVEVELSALRMDIRNYICAYSPFQGFDWWTFPWLTSIKPQNKLNLIFLAILCGQNATVGVGRIHQVFLKTSSNLCTEKLNTNKNGVFFGGMSTGYSVLQTIFNYCYLNVQITLTFDTLTQILLKVISITWLISQPF